MSKRLQRPEQVKDWLVRRYNSQHRVWLEGGGEWPLEVNLGLPTEADFASDLSSVRSWVDAWAGWRGAGDLRHEQRRYMRLGPQTLPSAVVLARPEEVAAWCGQERRWTRAVQRYAEMVARWPQLLERRGLAKHFDVLADYSEKDYARLTTALAWVLANPTSGLYVRQLPLEGVDTKWLEKRTGLIVELLDLLRGGEPSGDFYEACGLQRTPHRVRMRVLCPTLRRQLGGLRDIEAPLEELAALTLSPTAVLVVENQETGVALPDMPGVVAFMRLGGAVAALATIRWLQGLPAVYWGDVDTHGLAILSRARRTLPGLTSVLMDAATLERYADLAVQEPSQHGEAELAELTPAERDVFDGLRSGRWGVRVRLEQERIPWPDALLALEAALLGAQSAASSRATA
jgi:hypothetical protein